MYQFNYFEFTPREPFKQACSKWLGAMVDRVPSDSTCRASVTKVKNGYFFSVTIHSSVGTFQAENFLEDATADRSRRDWQIVALGEMEELMLNQLTKWLAARNLDKEFSAQGTADEYQFNRRAG